MSSLRRLLPQRAIITTATTTTTTAITPLRAATPSLLPRLLLSTTTTTSTTATRLYSSSNNTFKATPSPPRLPASEQAEFERLQRAVADRFADPTPLPHEQQQQQQASTSSSTNTTTTQEPAAVQSNKTEELPTTGGVWRGAKPEFEGDTNPKTGEVGGPKTEPLRWGSGGDWSYNGRVTDF